MGEIKHIWAEKYKPKTVSECILPPRIKEKFEAFIKNGDFPHLILSGSPGVGKTTIAVALCEELGLEYIILNGSKENGIDVVRTTLDEFCRIKSLNGKKKVVIYDEADHLNQNSTQPALRNFMDSYESDNIFIYTCNYVQKIIEPLVSRCFSIDFYIYQDEIEYMVSSFRRRCMEILDNEGITYDKKVLTKYIVMKYPDFRSTLIGLKGHALTGQIDAGILRQKKDYDIDTLIEILKSKSYSKARAWVSNNYDDNIYGSMMVIERHTASPIDTAEAIIILADYQYKSSMVADKELNLLACLCHLMKEVEFNG